MSDAIRWTIAIAVCLVAGGIATLYLLTVALRRDTQTAGIAALTTLSWRNFIRIVLDALARRGYSRVFDRQAPSGDDDYTLERDGERRLLSCKHGSTFVLGLPAVNDLTDKIRLAGATGGLLVTQGKIVAAARDVASRQNIELLDGPTLWPELRDLIPAPQLAEIEAAARQKARQRVLFSWLVALLLGVACLLLLPRPEVMAVTPEKMRTEASAPASFVSGEPSADATHPSRAAAAAPARRDDKTPEQQRKDLAAAVSALPMVDRAVWTTRSTLQVYLTDGNADVIGRICPLLVRHDALASSRVQLTPPAGSDLPTRFRQCRSY